MLAPSENCDGVIEVLVSDAHFQLQELVVRQPNLVGSRWTCPIISKHASVVVPEVVGRFKLPNDRPIPENLFHDNKLIDLLLFACLINKLAAFYFCNWLTLRVVLAVVAKS